jgi:hypothetical protein
MQLRGGPIDALRLTTRCLLAPRVCVPFLDRGQANLRQRYTRYEVVGFGVANGAPAVRIDRMGPDNYWFGARPQLNQAFSVSIVTFTGEHTNVLERAVGDPVNWSPTS